MYVDFFVYSRYMVRLVTRAAYGGAEGWQFPNFQKKVISSLGSIHDREDDHGCL